MAVKVGAALGALCLDKLSMRNGAKHVQMPSWAVWLIWLGAWMRCQTAIEGRRVVVVRLPTRRLAAAFVGFGAMLAAARLHDEALDWETLQGLQPGTTVYWRQANGGTPTNFAGRIQETRDFDGDAVLAIEVDSPRRSKGSTFLLPQATALSYGVTLGAVTARIDQRLSSLSELLKLVVQGGSQSWVRSPIVDSTVVTECATFIDDLEGISLGAGDRLVIPLVEALSIADARGRKHGKLLLVPSRAANLEGAAPGITVLDGAASAARIGETAANSVVVLLDYAECDEEVMHSIQPFYSHSIDAGVWAPIGMPTAMPQGVDAFVFGLPMGASASA